MEYLSTSFSFFRQAREDCSAVLNAVRARGRGRVVLAGVSDLAEIAILCALEHGIVIVAVVDAKFAGDRFVGAPVVPSIADVTGGFEALIVTDLEATEVSVRAAIDQFGGDRVLVPALLQILVDGRAQ